MRIPSDAIIPDDKLAEYLLRPRAYNDKSKFLARAGFSRGDPEALLRALRELAASCEAVEDGLNEYGTFLRAEGELVGPSGSVLRVVTVWLRWHADGRVHFVTLKPQR